MFEVDKQVVAQNLKSISARYNYTHADMARILGLEYHAYYAYVRNKTEKITIPPLNVLVNVCLIFNVSLDWLIGLTEEGGVWQ